MGLSETRKILSVIIAVITAFASAALIITIIINSMLTYEPFLEKAIITDELVSKCDEQLSAKYNVLRVETGIPVRVFEQVKNDYDVRDSLTRALQNVFSEEDAALYNKSFVDYFDTLITEFLKGSEVKYNKDDVRNTAEKATNIYCDTVGFHNVGASKKRLSLMKSVCSKLGLMSALALLIGILMTMIIYNERPKGYLCTLMGISSGALGTFIASVFCFIGRVWNKIELMPEVFSDSVNSIMKLYFTALVLVSLAVAVITYFIALMTYRKIKKKEQRVIVV